jgi:hypothetical protein
LVTYSQASLHLHPQDGPFCGYVHQHCPSNFISQAPKCHLLGLASSHKNCQMKMLLNYWPTWNVPLQVFNVCCKNVKIAIENISQAPIHLWSLQLISQASKPVVKAFGLWGSVKALSRGYEYLMGIVIFVPVAVLAWFPFVSEFQTRLLFNQAFSRGLQISRILAGGKKLSKCLGECGVERCASVRSWCFLSYLIQSSCVRS